MSFPGLVSKLSEEIVSLASTITPKSDIIRVTSTATTTVLTTIVPPFAGFSGQLILINQSGAAITSVTTGNILTATTIQDSRATTLVYSKGAAKWVVGSTT